MSIRRVIIDGTIVRSEQGGARMYSYGLAHALAEHDDLDVAVIVRSGSEADWPGLRTVAASLRSTNPLIRAAWRELRLSRMAAELDGDVLLVPAHELPLRQPRLPTVMVILDVGPLTAPGLYGWRRWVRYAATLRSATSKASAVVCISHATKLGLHGYLGIDPDRMTVIGMGPQLFRGVEATGDNGDDELSLPFGRFVLYVGAALRHKNLGTLIRAFASPNPSLDGEGLVIVGPEYGDERRLLEQEIERHGAQGRVVHLGFVSPAVLKELYSRADLLAFPSLNEGFGMPLLEAMDAQLPIVATDLPVFREVAGDAVRYVDQPLEPIAWAQAIGELLNDKDESHRLVQRGRAVRERHSWSEVADEFVALFSSLEPPQRRHGRRGPDAAPRDTSDAPARGQ